MKKKFFDAFVYGAGLTAGGITMYYILLAFWREVVFVGLGQAGM
jgi:hypothetical protein